MLNKQLNTYSYYSAEYRRFLKQMKVSLATVVKN